METHFFAMLSRMKYINRWSLMRNTRDENLCEHSLETAVIAHALAVLRNRRFGGSINVERVALLAIYHDVPEILTGDLPTPVKYHTPKIRAAYEEVEHYAVEKLLHMLPADLRPSYAPLLTGTDPQDAEYHSLIKAADKLSALIKCLEEKKSGNLEFVKAEKTLRRAIETLGIPEATVFLTEMLPAYTLTLDEQD